MNSVLLENLNQEILATSAAEYYPFFDISLTYLASYSLAGMLTVGVGVCFDRLIPINSSRTTLHSQKNIASPQPSDSNFTGDTTYYTFKGTKVMARASFDPKNLLPFGQSFFGAEDLKIYAEAMVLGIRNYPFWYDTLWQRIPVVAGFNIPVCKVLDVLAFEMEWYGCRYPMSIKAIKFDGTPLPDVTMSSYIPSEYRDDDVKWSIYGRKNFLSALYVAGQIARDHSHLVYTDGAPSYAEGFTKPLHWYWAIKLGYQY
jgi:hypothetical protein